MLKNLLSSYLKNQSGNISLAFGLFVIPIFLGAGIAIDTIKAVRTKASLQAAADAGALAGAMNAKLSEDEIREIVRKFALKNGANSELSKVLEIESNPDFKNGAFDVSIKGSLNTSLMSMFGFKTIDVSVASQVSVGSRALDIALVLDTTGSMNNPSSKMTALKSSANLLLDIITQTKADYSTLRVGVVPFAEYVNVGATLNTSSHIDQSSPGLTWSGCVGPRPREIAGDIFGVAKYPAMSTDVATRCPEGVLPLTEDIKKVRSTIASLTPEGYTFIPAGITWGWNVLSDAGPYTQGLSKDEMQKLQGKRIMILMTDGANTIAPYPANTYVAKGVVPTVANEMTAELCANAKKDDIGIFTISFMVTDPTIQNILDTCATETSNSYNADNSAQLTAAFTDIGNKLSQIRLSQ